MERTLDLRLRLTFEPRFLRPWLAGAFVLLLAGDLASESVTLTTYYPAPSGVYTNLITTNNTFLARDGGRVGVGNVAPAFKLDVSGTFRTTGAAQMDSNATVSGALSVAGAATVGGNAQVSGTSRLIGNVGVGSSVPSGSGRGYLYIDNSNTGCYETDAAGDVWGTVCPNGYYVTSQPGFYIEGWSYFNRGGQTLVQTGAGQASTQVWGLNNCSGGGSGCTGNPTWMTLKKDDSTMHLFCCLK